MADIELTGGALYSAVNQLCCSQQHVPLQFLLKSIQTHTKPLSTVFTKAAILQLVQTERSFRKPITVGGERVEWGEQMNPFGFISKPLLPVTWFLFVSIVCFRCVQTANRFAQGQNSSIGCSERKCIQQLAVCPCSYFLVIVESAKSWPIIYTKYIYLITESWRPPVEQQWPCRSVPYPSSLGMNKVYGGHLYVRVCMFLSGGAPPCSAGSNKITFLMFRCFFDWMTIWRKDFLSPFSVMSCRVRPVACEQMMV